MSTSLSVGGPSIWSSKSQSNKLFVGTVNGIFVVEKVDNKWRVVSRKLEGCHIHALLIEPQTSQMFAGVHKGSIFVSKDSGDTWELKEKGLTQKNIYSLNCVTVEGKPRIYAGTEPAHLFESADLGETWKELPSLRNVPSLPKWTFPAPPHQAHVKSVGFDPLIGTTIYACVEQGGLFRSKDAGKEWVELHGFDMNLPFQVPDGAAVDDVHRILVKRSDPKCLYISGGVGICQSRDGGSSWEHLMPPQSRIGYPDALLIHPNREDLMFTAGASENPKGWRVSHDADAAIARSRDGGRNWEILRSGLPSHMRGHIAAMSMEAWKDSCVLYAGNTSGEIFCSENDGDSWTKIINVEPISKAGHYISLGGSPASNTAATL